MSLNHAARSVFAPPPATGCTHAETRRRGEYGIALIALGALMGLDNPLRAPVISIAGGLVGGFLVAASTRGACTR